MKVHIPTLTDYSLKIRNALDCVQSIPTYLPMRMILKDPVCVIYETFCRMMAPLSSGLLISNGMCFFTFTQMKILAKKSSCFKSATVIENNKENVSTIKESVFPLFQYLPTWVCILKVVFNSTSKN